WSVFPSARRRAWDGARRLGAVMLLPLLLAGIPAVHAQPAGLPELGDSASAELSPRMEQRLGDALMTEGRRDPTYINDPAINQYLTDMARRLASSLSNAPSLNVLRLRYARLYAFALPGGHLRLPSCLSGSAQPAASLPGTLAL